MGTIRVYILDQHLIIQWNGRLMKMMMYCLMRLFISLMKNMIQHMKLLLRMVIQQLKICGDNIQCRVDGMTLGENGAFDFLDNPANERPDPTARTVTFGDDDDALCIEEL